MARVKATPGRLRLRLYIAGSAPNSVRAVANVRMLCDEHFAEGHEIEIIVTPTLLKLSPTPAQRMVGNLNDTGQVLLTLSAG